MTSASGTLPPAGDSGRLRTLEQDAQAEARIGEDLRNISAAVSQRLGKALRALLLVGGYARGEGSVVERDGGLGAYNDYDLIAIVGGTPQRFHAPLRALSREWTPRVGVDVDLWPLPESDMPTVPATLFWLDVSLGGAEVLSGAPGCARQLRNLAPRQVPLEEAGRLLTNRAVGLALSNLEAVDRDLRRARHGHKMALAMGDALLLASDHYAPTLRQRLEALRALRGSPSIDADLVAAYEDATRFRARPDLWKPPEHSLDRWYAIQRRKLGRWHLAFDAWRVSSPVTAEQYVRFGGQLFPNLPDVPRGRAWLSSFRAAARGQASLLPYYGHVRERLGRIAVALAYGHEQPACRSVAARLLGTSVDADDATLHQKLEALARAGG